MITVKELVKDTRAVFTHAIAGILYYEIELPDGSIYQFNVDMNDKDDVGTATFDANLKAITLMRYINKCIKNTTLIKLK